MTWMPGVVETPGERPAFDEEVDLEAGQQHVVERADDEFVLTDGNDAHVRPILTRADRLGRGCPSPRNSHYTPWYDPAPQVPPAIRLVLAC